MVVADNDRERARKDLYSRARADDRVRALQIITLFRQMRSADHPHLAKLVSQHEGVRHRTVSCVDDPLIQTAVWRLGQMLPLSKGIVSMARTAQCVTEVTNYERVGLVREVGNPAMAVRKSSRLDAQRYSSALDFLQIAKQAWVRQTPFQRRAWLRTQGRSFHREYRPEGTDVILRYAVDRQPRVPVNDGRHVDEESAPSSTASHTVPGPTPT